MVKKSRFIVLFLLIPSVFWFSACASLRGERAAMEPRISSYIRTWPIPETVREGDNPYWNAGMIKGEYITDLMIAFALIDPSDGTSIFIPEYPEFNIWEEVAVLKEKYPHLKVSFSVGGGSAAGLAGFSKMAANPAMRATFAANICKWLEDYNLDGVDVDWEYPVGPPWDEVKYPQDRKNYISLLRELREATNKLGEKTGKHYVLSTAIPASPWFVQANDARAAAKIVDYLKIMTYDYYGPWSTTTGHNASLYNNPMDPAWGGWSTDQGLKGYFDDWIPMEKIMLGVAFYGRGWKGVEAGPNKDTPGLFMPYDKSSLPFNAEGALAYSEIKELLKPGSGYTRYWDDVGKAPYLYNGDTMLSYTDEELIKLLTDFAKEKKLAGVFVWEYGHDLDADLMKVLAENMR
jgi:chitinase